MKVYLNGRILPHSKAHISVDDRGFLAGDGVYETLRFYDGEPFLLADHLSRLGASLRRLRIRPAVSLAAIGQSARALVAANHLSNAVVRITVTRGPGPRGFDPRLCHAPTVLITAAPLPPMPPSLYRRGISAAIVAVARNDRRATPPEVKSISCLNNVLAKMAANSLGVEEAIMLSSSGNISEGTISNVFAVRRGSILTPALDGGLLPGVTRSFVLRLARRLGIRVRETRLRPTDLMSADEVFLTSSVREILPVARLVDARGSRRTSVRLKVGPVTAVLIRAFRGEMLNSMKFSGRR